MKTYKLELTQRELNTLFCLAHNYWADLVNRKQTQKTLNENLKRSNLLVKKIRTLNNS